MIFPILKCFRWFVCHHERMSGGRVPIFSIRCTLDDTRRFTFFIASLRYDVYEASLPTESVGFPLNSSNRLPLYLNRLHGWYRSVSRIRSSESRTKWNETTFFSMKLDDERRNDREDARFSAGSIDAGGSAVSKR